ncbi:heme lyase CcmF/NrfE family subunit [Halalkalibaculum sp. DA3122]|uniref:heme lyase CcmF/NrfE family subunit n=1 Tax=Halalkalibaculum sp. DA3122 TaxID=3373607 RepID=UPI003754E2EC
MIGTIGNILIYVAFATSIFAGIGYFLYSSRDDERLYRISNWLFGIKGALIIAASGLLLYLILNHQFQYYYVYNYTSSDLQLKYLISALWGGQEGSFMVWILCSFFIGLGLMKWTEKPYRGPVLFFLTLTQIFLISMIAGVSIGDLQLGASPFRTLAQEMPNAPFIQANPDFVPSEGKGLNDLLKSPWMMIHPPVLFLGFAMMTIPYCFAMAALWKEKYNEWVHPAMPWTLGANVALLTAIFLGGYWAYVTLSFGGYWAWDPVENASFVPWLLGTAGIHTMVIQKKSSTSQKASIVFAILAYVAIVYETFLTRSGILADSSVHSFVDLGLYNQLLAFMFVVTAVGIGMLIYRYKDLPRQNKESKLLSREFMTFAGAMVLFLIGFVIIIGTSSPIIGRLFEANPTPPEISFYNEWTMPLAILAAFMTVIGQFLFWKRQDAESLARDLTWPVIISCVLTLATMMLGNVRNFYYLLYILAGWFALVGNGFMMVRMMFKNPKLIGGALTHVGFGVLLLGILASSAYNGTLLDLSTRNYNEAIAAGKVTDDEGIPVRQKVNFLELKLNEPKVVNGKYKVTYEGYTLANQERPGQQQYKIKFEPVDGNGRQFTLYPEVYPMLSSSSANRIEWSVDPDVYTTFMSDIYMYVAGSSYVEQKNEQVKNNSPDNSNMQPASASQTTPDQQSDSTQVQTISLGRGESLNMGGYQFDFSDYTPADPESLPDSTLIAVRADLDVIHRATGVRDTLNPLFAIYKKDGKSWTYAPPMQVPGRDMFVQFTSVDPSTGKIELKVHGIEGEPQDEWVLIVAEEKPFVSVVWLGTFILMAGFSVSIFRHWDRDRKKN